VATSDVAGKILSLHLENIHCYKMCLGLFRYVGGHSHAHFTDTHHCYTMELGANRVWDYVGDNFVHRLVQVGDIFTERFIKGIDVPQAHKPNIFSTEDEIIFKINLETIRFKNNTCKGGKNLILANLNITKLRTISL